MRTSWGPSGNLFEHLIRPHLLEVQKPARYIGGEQGAVVKDWDSTALHFAYGFPDLYELGMSYHGREVLCQRLNARPDVLCERTFIPGPDMQALMREKGVGLWALESKRPVADFNVLGISLTHELAFPSALLLLDLAGIAVRSEARDDQDPIVIAGGQAMCNPEPVAPFFDVIVSGEGEEVLDEIVDLLLASGAESREQRISRLARLEGCYVPCLFDKDPRRAPQAHLGPGSDSPRRIARRYIRDFGESCPPLNPVLPHIAVPADKVYLEVLRGCPRGCRFCQAGWITRPARARRVEDLASAAALLAGNTGADEVGLLSLSTLDHPEALDLIRAVHESVPAEVGIAVPSLRADAMSAELARLTRRPRETSLTIAIEAGGEHLRQAINKGVGDIDVLETFEHLMVAGWHKFKLYFMCGFSGEPLSAMDEIAALVERILALARANGLRRPSLTISLAVLVPKAHTPFQWQAMERPDVTAQKQRRLRAQLRALGGGIRYRWHDPEQSVIEALLSRGGRQLADVVEEAFRTGQTLLSDHFDMAVWRRILQRQGVSLEREVFRERNLEECLPWDHIARGVSKRHLWDQWEAYQRGEPTPPCHDECTVCGIGCGAPVFAE